MKVMLRPDDLPNVCIIQIDWQTLRTVEDIDVQIRALQTARRWLIDEQKRKAMK